MSPKGLQIWIAMVALALGLAGARADTIYKTDGNVKEGKIIAENADEVVFEMTFGAMKASIRIPRSEIARIVRSGPAPEAGKGQEPEAARKEAVETMKKGRDLLQAGQYDPAAQTLAPLLSLPMGSLNSLERKAVLGDLIACDERLGAWDKALAAYEDFLKCATIDKGEVAVIRVKQRLLKEHPDGMIDVNAGSPPGRPGERNDREMRALSNPKVMALALRREAEKILEEAEQKAARAEAQVASEKTWGTAPIKVSASLDRSLTGPKRVTITKSAGYVLYEQAAEDAAEADCLAAGISTPLRLKIAQKLAALIEEQIVGLRKELEGHAYYMAPPAAGLSAANEAAFRRDQALRVQALNVTKVPAKEYLEIVVQLEVLGDARLEALEPFSDQLPEQTEKLRKEREQIADVRQQADQVAELWEAVQECERLEEQFEDFAAKAKANDPAGFNDYGYERFLDQNGIYPFKKESARRWRDRSDLCAGLCQKAEQAGGKWIVLMKKFPDRPQFVRQIEVVKSKITQVYALQVKVYADRGRKGRSPAL